MQLYRIGIEDLASNALIECLKDKEGDLTNYVVTYKTLERYGKQVQAHLDGKGISSLLVFGRCNTYRMYHEYSKFFVEGNSVEGKGVSLVSGVTIKALIEHWRMFTPVDLLFTYMDKTALRGIDVVERVKQYSKREV